MKRYFGIPVLALGMTLGYIAAQQARHEITKASPGDKKGLSASVPDVYAIPGQFQRIVVLRFKNQTDLLAGLTKMVAEQKIRNAVILSGIGSVRNYQIHSSAIATFLRRTCSRKIPNHPRTS